MPRYPVRMTFIDERRWGAIQAGAGCNNPLWGDIARGACRLGGKHEWNIFTLSVAIHAGTTAG